PNFRLQAAVQANERMQESLDRLSTLLAQAKGELDQFHTMLRAVQDNQETVQERSSAAVAYEPGCEGCDLNRMEPGCEGCFRISRPLRNRNAKGRNRDVAVHHDQER